MSSSVGERFQRLPGMQRAREAEYDHQAEEAEALLRRLRDTRIEAEKAANEEIEQTRRMQVTEYNRHPDLLKWRQRLREAEMKVRSWSEEVEKKSQVLRETIAVLERQLKRKQEELNRLQGEMEGRRLEEDRLRGQITDLESELNNLTEQCRMAEINEDDLSNRIEPLHGEQARLNEQIESMKARRAQAGREWDSLKGREMSLVASRDSIEKEIQKLSGELVGWQNRLSEVAEQIFRAEGLFADAQNMCHQHQDRAKQFGFERDSIAQQLQQLKDEKGNVFRTFEDLEKRIKEKQANIGGFESKLAPMRQRYEGLQRKIKELQDEAAMLDRQFGEQEQRLFAERAELDNLWPMQQQAESQLGQITQIYRNAEEEFNRCLGQIAHEDKLAREFEAKAKEAHDEVHKAKTIETLASDGRKRAEETLFKCQRSIEDIDRQLGEVEANFASIQNPSALDQGIHQRQMDSERLTETYKSLLEERRSVHSRREGLQHKIRGLESRLRTLRGQLEEGFGRTDVYSRLTADIGRIEDELGGAKSELSSLGGSNPYLSELDSLRSQTSTIESTIYSSWNASNAPQSLLAQLKRETEVVMRAEAALTLERQQEAVVQDASKLTRYHLTSSPRFVVDEEATNVLLVEHSQQHGAREIASRVLEMCESKHIHA